MILVIFSFEKFASLKPQKTKKLLPSAHNFHSVCKGEGPRPCQWDIFCQRKHKHEGWTLRTNLRIRQTWFFMVQTWGFPMFQGVTQLFWLTLKPPKKNYKKTVDFGFVSTSHRSLPIELGCKEKQQYTPGRLIWNIIMEVWKMIFLYNWVICRFHVNLPGCTPWSLT